MSTLGNRLSKLEARQKVPFAAVIRVFDPLDGGDIDQRIAVAEQEASARGEQLISIIVRDPKWPVG